MRLPPAVPAAALLIALAVPAAHARWDNPASFDVREGTWTLSPGDRPGTVDFWLKAGT